MHRVVLANGCFDPLHYGHMIHLEAARRFGDELVVSVSSDAAVRKQKGVSRLFCSQEERVRMLRLLRCVDKVVVVEGLIEALEIVRPDVLVKGSDYRDGLEPHHAAYCRENGIDVAFTETPKWSVLEIADELRSR